MQRMRSAGLAPDRTVPVPVQLPAKLAKGPEAADANGSTEKITVAQVNAARKTNGNRREVRCNGKLPIG